CHNKLEKVSKPHLKADLGESILRASLRSHYEDDGDLRSYQSLLFQGGIQNVGSLQVIFHERFVQSHEDLQSRLTREVLQCSHRQALLNLQKRHRMLGLSELR